MFCKYRDILGVPGTGFHSMRFLDVAIGDYISTILLAMVVSYVTKYPLVLTTIFMFVLGLILHILFCVPTSATKFLGL